MPVDAVDQVGDQLHGVLLEAGAEILDQRRPVGGVLPSAKSRATEIDSWRSEIIRATRSPTVGSGPVVDVCRRVRATDD